MAQLIIDTGAAANDGTGDPLRTAFTETNTNFTAIFTAGPVDSNVRITDNTILTLNTNGNLVLAPNGVGKVVANVDIVPNSSNIRNLGSTSNRWSTVYSQYLNISGAANFLSDVTVAGNLTVTGDSIELGNIITDALTLQLGNTASTELAANGAGITVGSNDDIATILYNASGNVWTTNIGISAAGNVTAPYFIGDGSQLTGLADSYANANVVSYAETGWAGNIIPSADNTYSLGNATNQWSELHVANATIYIGGVALGVSGNTLTVAGEPVLSNDSADSITTTGNITADYFIGDGSQLTNLPSGTNITNGTSLITIPTAGSNIIVGVDNVGSTEFTQLGINTINLAALGNVTVDGTVQGNVVTADSAINTAGTIAATGNITGSNIISDGEIISDGRAYVQYVDIRGGYSSGWIGSLGYGGNIVELQGTAGVNIVTTGDEGGPTWRFGTDGDLTVPGYVQFEGNTFIGDEPGGGSPAFRIVTPLTYGATIETDSDISGNSWTWTFGADGVLGAPGNITATNFIGDIAASNVTGLATVATSGAYSDLSGAPTTVSSFTNDANYVASNITGITGADQVTNMVSLTQAEYDAITPNASTVYFIVG